MLLTKRSTPRYSRFVATASLQLLTEKRAEIVNLLKRRGGLSAGTLATELRISTVAVRRHLEQLESRGIVTHVLEQGERGRPGFRYQLTTNGDGLFPDTTPAFACDLLAEAELAFGVGAVTRLLAGRADRVIADLQSEFAQLPFEERVVALARRFNDMGFVADVQKLDDGTLVVVEHNCPTREVAERFPQLCEEELRVYTEVTGGYVYRACRLADGGSSCEYRIVRTENAPRRLPVLVLDGTRNGHG
jgi:predicted ArsR family transcriptional regulator